MLIRFYVSQDGEVLSNKTMPVDKPLYLIPELDGARAIRANDISEMELEEIKIKYEGFFMAGPGAGPS